MATQVNARNSCWLDGVQVAAQDLRLQQVSGFLTSTGAAGTTGVAATPGVRNSVGTPLASSWVSGMTFNLLAGVCWAQGTASTIAGLYELVLDTTTLLTVPTSDPTNPRIDSVIAVVVDVGTSSSTAVFKILPGTPNASPVAPTLPANALRLTNITVGAGVSTLSAGVFADVRVYSVAAGGILPYAVATPGTAVTGPDGSYLDDLSTGRLRRVVSGVARAAKTAAFTPVSTQGASSVTAAVGTPTALATAAITADGSTELELWGSWTGMYSNAAVALGDFCSFAFYNVTLGGSALSVAQTVYRPDSTSLNVGDGGNVRMWYTPPAGTYTLGLYAFSTGHTFNVAYPYIRVGPAFN